jgi:hypothetical protein
MSNRRRSRVARVLFWILLIIVALIVLSILFGGFQKGAKAAPRPLFSHTSLTVSRDSAITPRTP